MKCCIAQRFHVNNKDTKYYADVLNVFKVTKTTLKRCQLW